MHFAVDAHAIGRRLTGNEVYVRNLLNTFDSLDRTSEFTAFYCSASAVGQIPARFIKCRVASNPFVRLGADIPLRLWRNRPNLLHVQYTAPLVCPVPVITSVHDVSFLEHPDYFTKARAFQLRHTVENTIRRAAMVIVPSEFSRRMVLSHYGVSADKVVAIPIAASPAFRPLPRDPARDRIRERFGVAAPFLLSVGDLQPRKNQIGLIAAFADLLREFPTLPHHLVLAGKDTWFAEKVHEAARKSGFASRIHFTGFVTDTELLDLYAACSMFVFPSHYEGFGMPVLEAMACGRAVACSNATALPEVANATALLFAPDDRRQMVLAMRDLLLDSELRARMERLSVQRAAAFSWENTARMTLEIYYAVAGQVRQKAVRSQPVPLTRP
jgi:glycosyltransferase involved in cell wall biosynthesis